jgi:cell division protein FtsB
MRVLAFILCLALVLLQYRLWLSDQGLREVARLQAAIDAQTLANHDQSSRNRQLLAEVTDLKVGLTALEERARSDLGMVGSRETFYQVVNAAPAEPDAGASETAGAPVTAGAPATARAQ